MRLGYFLSCEENGPHDLVTQAQLAEQAGFQGLWISDHYHPWNDAQGESPFVWSVIGAIAQVCSLPITTAVTCPTVRTHPAIVAQAAATSGVLCHGRFVLGVGSGEALNEHVLGDRWPNAKVRLRMLDEAVEVLRKLFTGRVVDHYGTHYTVDHARVYTRPAEPVPIYVSAFGQRSARLAAGIGDGLMSTIPDAGLVRAFRDAGGGDKPAQGGFKVCYGTDEENTRAVAHRLWANELLPGELAQVLPTPEHVMQASTLVAEEKVAGSIVCGPDPARHVERVRRFVDAGYDEVYVNQIGSGHEEFFEFYAEHVLPRCAG